MTTPTTHAPTSTARTRLIVRCLARLLGRPRRGSRSTAAPERRHAPPLAVLRVDDPDGRRRIRALRGLVPDCACDELAAHVHDLAAGDQVHLELTDAIIVGTTTMARLGVIADRLEARGVDVRIVGVDPDHPAIPRAR